MIRMVEDLGAPLTVTAIDLVTLEAAPDWNEWAAYLMTAVGYAGGLLNFGGPYVKQIGVASLPLTARHIRDRVKGGMAGKVTRNRVTFRPTKVGRAYEPEFEPAGAQAF